MLWGPLGLTENTLLAAANNVFAQCDRMGAVVQFRQGTSVMLAADNIEPVPRFPWKEQFSRSHSREGGRAG